MTRSGYSVAFNHNETLVPVVRNGRLPNHNETLVRAVRYGVNLANHNETRVRVRGRRVVADDGKTPVRAYA